jgi:hypothetical protein
MATTTTNYGFDIPQSTDLVKDGATAIATLGQDIDTAMNTALGTKKAGMVLLNTTSFSAVATQSISDVFSTTYDNYRVVCNVQPSTTVDLQMRYRVSGADNSTSNYNYEGFVTRPNNTNASVSGATNQTSFVIAGLNNGNANAFSMDIYQPFISDFTKHSLIGHMHDSTSYNASLRGGVFAATTSFTGFTIYPSSGTMTGTVSVYGYNK